MTGSMTETAKLEALALDLTKRIEREFYYDHPGGAVQTRSKVQAILSDALRALSRPAVKGLGVWRRGYCDELVTIEQASTGFGSIYQVRVFEGKVWLDHPDQRKEECQTVEAAKAAAQSDFEHRILSSLSPPTGTGEPLTFGYTNWRGEYAERTAIPLRIERKESEWHGPGLHYVMVAFDVEKQAERDFLLTDMGRPPSPPEAE